MGEFLELLSSFGWLSYLGDAFRWKSLSAKEKALCIVVWTLTVIFALAVLFVVALVLVQRFKPDGL